MLAYLELVARTSRVVMRGTENVTGDTLIGFWHGDSYCMQLVLRELAPRYPRVRIVVTADRRGDYIDRMARHYGGEALRMRDGVSARHSLRTLREASRASGIVAAALDGPTGPLHRPKKLLFQLASDAGKEVACISFAYSRVIRLRRRWDRYVIPLPFCRITADFAALGTVSGEDLRGFERYAARIVKT